MTPSPNYAGPPRAMRTALALALLACAVLPVRVLAEAAPQPPVETAAFYGQLAAIYANYGRNDEAEAMLRKAIELAKNEKPGPVPPYYYGQIASQYVQLGETDKAREVLKQAAAAPKTAPTTRDERARRAMYGQLIGIYASSGDYDKALALLDELGPQEKRAPNENDLYPFRNLFQSLANGRQFEAALGVLQELRRIKPEPGMADSSYFYSNLANQLMQGRHYEEAEKALRTGLEKTRTDDERSMVTYNLFRCLRDMGKKQEALALAREALDTRLSAWVRGQMSPYVIADSLDGNDKEARALLERAFQDCGTSVHQMALLANQLRSAGELRDRADKLMALLDTMPASPAADMVRSVFLVHVLDKPGQAVPLLEKIRKDAPKDTQTADLLFQACVNAQLYDKAVVCGRELLALNDQPYMATRVADVMVKAGKPEDAIALLEGRLTQRAADFQMIWRSLLPLLVNSRQGEKALALCRDLAKSDRPAAEKVSSLFLAASVARGAKDPALAVKICELVLELPEQADSHARAVREIEEAGKAGQ